MTQLRQIVIGGIEGEAGGTVRRTARLPDAHAPVRSETFRGQGLPRTDGRQHLPGCRCQREHTQADLGAGWSRRPAFENRDPQAAPSHGRNLREQTGNGEPGDAAADDEDVRGRRTVRV